ncbi:MAG TPA: helix-turn-helix domain-containing protein [Longimicrobiales bacterium]|nr:helix-turn-helix domain-containing protein [Longimicrobiales bacterium]
MLLRRPHDLAALFRDGRTRAGWSQTQLADRMGVSRQWISLVETGKTSVEFDLVFGALQALGYQLYLEPSAQSARTAGRAVEQPELPVHRPSARTPLTRSGEPLGTHRIRRRPREGRHD